MYRSGTGKTRLVPNRNQNSRDKYRFLKLRIGVGRYRYWFWGESRHVPTHKSRCIVAVDFSIKINHGHPCIDVYQHHRPFFFFSRTWRTDSPSLSPSLFFFTIISVSIRFTTTNYQQQVYNRLQRWTDWWEDGGATAEIQQEIQMVVVEIDICCWRGIRSQGWEDLLLIRNQNFDVLELRRLGWNFEDAEVRVMWVFEDFWYSYVKGLKTRV